MAGVSALNPTGWSRQLQLLGLAAALVCLLLVAYEQGSKRDCREETPARPLRSPAPPSPRSSLSASCGPYADAVQRAADLPKGAPQLSQAQLLWIAALLEGQAAAARTEAAEGRPRFLVFGLGHDSALWSGLNCKGRTAFLEHSQQWIDSIQGQYPHLEVHRVEYKGRVDRADEFFGVPWLMPVPADVGTACWDVILVDAPTGWTAEQPGRMESSYFAVEAARRCIASGEVEEVVVLLHDVEREVEGQIMKLIFQGQDVTPLGVITGRLGDLAAYRIHRPLGPP